ncbi:hypothetical protein D3C85_1332240 [compost metagenome]
MTCFGVENVFVDVRAECSANRIAIVAVRFIDSFKRIFSNLRITALQELNIAAVGELDFLAFFVLNLRELQVRIVEHAENRARCPRHVACLRKKCFLIFG